MQRQFVKHRSARISLAALAIAALGVCDTLAERGEENDTGPRQWLEAFVRWARSGEFKSQLSSRTRALHAWGASLTKGFSPEETSRLIFYATLVWLIDAREETMRGSMRRCRSTDICEHIATATSVLTGEPHDVVVRRVAERIDAYIAEETRKRR